MPKQEVPTISVIVRTKNEEKWIGYCLDAVFDQKVDANIEVILIDNESTDGTLEIARRYPVTRILSTKHFFPGKALNDGIRASAGDYIACLSAHCIAENSNWLSVMLANLQGNSAVAGVYGRQIPLSYSSPIDKRDLLIVFGLDKRVQLRDYFFHNANSMLPRSVWERFQFDEDVGNIEDRVWGKSVIDAGYQIVYEPDGVVYHHHGLHQGNDPSRAQGVVSILERISSEAVIKLPKAMQPGNINVAAVIPVLGEVAEGTNTEIRLKDCVRELKDAAFVSSVYCLCENESLAKKFELKWLDRGKIKGEKSVELNLLLKDALRLIELGGDFPDSLLYVNHSYEKRLSWIFDELISDAQSSGFDTVFPGLEDYGHYWFRQENGEYLQTDPSLALRGDRDPLLKACYGLGCLTATWVIRAGGMIGGKIGILKLPVHMSRKKNKDSD
jgi:rhamnosyltransferase